MRKILKALIAIFLFLLTIFGYIAIVANYPGLTPKQTAKILIEDDKLGARALPITSFWGDALFPELREISNDYSHLNDSSAELLMIVLSEKIKSKESLNLAKELYQRDNIEAKIVGAAGLAARGELPKEALRPNGYIYEAITYDPRVNAQNYKELVDPKKPHVELALIVAKYAKSNEVLVPTLRVLNYRGIIPYTLHANACDALGEMGDKRAIPDLEAALKDKEFYALPEAFDALIKLGDENAIPLAIKRITPEIQGHNSKFVVNELEKVTGKNFGFNQQAWTAWWDTRKPLIHQPN